MDLTQPVRPRLADPSLLKETCYVGGRWIESSNGRRTPVLNPATGATIGSVPNLTVADTRAAIDSAYDAQRAWRALTGKERAAYLRRLFELVMQNQEDLAQILTAEQGKPLAEARAEIAYAASFIEWFGEEAKRTYGDVIPQNVAGRRILVQKEPIGVYAAITPWNFPSAMITRKAAPGWAAGCTGVIRPATETPFSALALGALAERAGFPAGVCNVVTGSSTELGGEFCENTKVRKLSFTGSTRVGALLLAQCAPTIKKTSMELGGNAPFIVFEDADLDEAVKGAIMSKYRNTGQTCVCTNRFLVQDSVYDAFAAKLATAVAGLKVGDGVGEGVTQGPLINAAAVKKVVEHIDDAVARGARVLTGGRPHALGGLFFEPTVLAGVSDDALILREETFGPVAPLVRFTTEAEAIQRANDTEFGLAAYLYTRDVGRIFRVAEALEVGMVGVNEGAISTEVAPFGGVKASGVGREGSKYGIDEFMELKYLCLGGIGG